MCFYDFILQQIYLIILLLKIILGILNLFFQIGNLFIVLPILRLLLIETLIINLITFFLFLDLLVSIF